MAKIKDFINQIDNKIIAVKKCKIIIDLLNYDKDEIIINEEDETIWVKSLMSKLEFDDLILNFILDYPVEIQANNMKKIDSDYIEVIYNIDDEIIIVPLEAQELKEQIRYVERLLGGREIFKDVDHLYRKLFRIYGGSVSNMDSVHMEILLSNVLRDRNKLSQPARLGKTWDPVMINIKKIVFNSGFLQGLAFENINEAIKNGLISEDITDPSILEKVLTGEITKKTK